MIIMQTKPDFDFLILGLVEAHVDVIIVLGQTGDGSQQQQQGRRC